MNTNFSPAIKAPSQEFCQQFEVIFNIPIKLVMDNLLSIAGKKYSLDIFKFEKKLEEKNPDYCGDKCTYQGEEKVSFKMFLVKKYGKCADAMIDYLLEQNFDKSFDTFLIEKGIKNENK